MIIKIVQDDYIEARILLYDKEDKSSLALDESFDLEFVSNVRTRSYKEDTDNTKGTTQIVASAKNKDAEGNRIVCINTADYHISPGRYHFEINLVYPDGKKKCISRRELNELIVMPREEDIE